MTKSTKWTPELEARLREVGDKAGAMNLEICRALAEEDAFKAAGLTAKGIVFKARMLGYGYRKTAEVRDARESGTPEQSLADLGLKNPPPTKQNSEKAKSNGDVWKGLLVLAAIAAYFIYANVFYEEETISVGEYCKRGEVSATQYLRCLNRVKERQQRER